MKNALRLSLLVLPLLSKGVLASSTFVILYEQFPLSEVQADRLSTILDRPVKQILVDSNDAIDAHINQDNADLLLISKSYYKNLPTTSTVSIKNQVDWGPENWDYVDSQTLSSQRFYPYTVDFTSLAINADMLPPSMITGWSDAWDSQWSDQIAITKDYQSLFVVALDILGYEANTSNPVEIHSAYKLLENWLPNIHEISNAAELEMAFLSGEVVVGMSSNSGVYAVAQEGSPMKMLWHLDPIIKKTYGFAVPSSTREQLDSVKAIKWLANGMNAAEFAFTHQRVSAIESAKAILPVAYTMDPNLYPPQGVDMNFKNVTEYGGETELYKDYFDALCVEHEKSEF